MTDFGMRFKPGNSIDSGYLNIKIFQSVLYAILFAIMY